jgi:hypothetical protein
MGSGGVSFCGMSMDWNDVLADYEGIMCVCVCVRLCLLVYFWCVGTVGSDRPSYMQFLCKTNN